MYMRNSNHMPEPVPRRRFSLMPLFDFLYVGLLLYGAYCGLVQPLLMQKARLSTPIAAGSPQDPNPAMWITVEFKRYPDTGDHRDVRLTFQSPALNHDISLDWNYIATHAQEMAPNGMTRRPAPLPANEEPPLRRSIELYVPLDLKPQMRNIKDTHDVDLIAELYWGGERQSKTRCSIYRLYTWTPESG